MADFEADCSHVEARFVTTIYQDNKTTCIIYLSLRHVSRNPLKNKSFKFTIKYYILVLYVLSVLATSKAFI